MCDLHPYKRMEVTLSSGRTFTIEKCHHISKNLCPCTLRTPTEDCHHHVGKSRILLHPCTFYPHLSVLRSFLKIFFFFPISSELFYFTRFHLIKSLRNPHYMLCCKIPIPLEQPSMVCILDLPDWTFPIDQGLGTELLSKFNLQLNHYAKPCKMWIHWHFFLIYCHKFHEDQG